MMAILTLKVLDDGYFDFEVLDDGYFDFEGT